MNQAVRFDNKDREKDMQAALEEYEVYDFLKTYHNHSYTENGAAGYRTTGHSLLDLNFKVSSLRNREEALIVKYFMEAYYEGRKYAVKWLFFLRDILEGLGERRTFRVCLKYLAISHPETVKAVLDLVPEYGRFDDLLCLLDTPVCDEVCAFFKQQLDKDMASVKAGKPVSLLAKWLPSSNTSSRETRRMASVVAKKLGMGERSYRRMLTKLRSYSNVLETKLSASRWSEINYEAVPAKANLKYEEAFLRHDRLGREAYFKKVLTEGGKLNTAGLMPYEIVHRMQGSSYPYAIKDDVLAELMWQKIRQDGFQNNWGLERCIVVADGSGSMLTPVSGSTTVTAMDVCNSLAIYFAEQLGGVFHNKAITFSSRPQFIDLEAGRSLKEKLEIMRLHNEVANTNIEAVFDLLLAMAMDEHVPAEQLPKQVLIISDMEFDAANRPSYWDRAVVPWKPFNQALFQTIKQKFEAAGYAMPQLVFWNVCGRTDTVPMADNDKDICLLSGFSQNAMKAAANKEAQDPYEKLLKTLDSPRYLSVETALKKIA